MIDRRYIGVSETSVSHGGEDRDSTFLLSLTNRVQDHTALLKSQKT
jgi:hypothetical protein